VLAACSDGGTANETLPSTSTSAAETSESLAPLGPADFPVPSEARQQTPDGVRAFTTYYLDLADFLLSSLDSEPLRELSSQCEACDQLADTYDADRVAGIRTEGGDISVTSTGTAWANSGQGEISFLLHQTAVAAFDSAGQPLAARSSPAFDLSGGMTFSWDATRSTWVVTQLTAERL
jgi:hypothetical protein